MLANRGNEEGVQKRHIDNAMSFLDCNTRNIHNASQLQGMIWMHPVWNKLSSDIDKKCWRHINLGEDDCTHSLPPEELTSSLAELV